MSKSSIGAWRSVSPAVHLCVLQPHGVSVGLVAGEQRAALIDCGSTPGQGAALLERARGFAGVPVSHVVVTHPHHDHSGGVQSLKNGFMESPVYGEADIDLATHTVTAGTQFPFGDGLVTVWATPGHTDRHVSYLLENAEGLHVFCGDTLFSAGCGRVFTGTIEDLYDSFQRFNQLPEDTLFYPAHEYTAANLRFAEFIEPENPDIQAALRAAEDTPTLPVTLAHERKINPFLRVDLPHVRERVEDLVGKQLDSGLEVFAALRELKNRF